MEENENIEAECNICDWKGLISEMIEPLDEDDTFSCPECSSQNIYYFKQPQP